MESIMYALKLRQVGSSTGVVLPKELLAQMNAKQGEEVYATVTPDGLLLSALNPETRAQLELIEAGMDEYKDVYAFLAK
ncbi:MAG: AbrB/MazE/SpoVT family DNA-binding domain-containing protein [Rhizomicrobium sp.]